MLTDAWALAISRICDVFILLYSDVPVEERREGWRRWYKFWRPLWAKLGLDVEADPIPPMVPK